MGFGAGAMVNHGSIPMVCGGFNWTDHIKECYQLIDKEWHQTESLPEPRSLMSTGI